MLHQLFFSGNQMFPILFLLKVEDLFQLHLLFFLSLFIEVWKAIFYHAKKREKEYFKYL